MRRYTIERFIEEANDAKSTQEVARLFGDVLKEYGYDRYCYSLITDHPSLGGWMRGTALWQIILKTGCRITKPIVMKRKTRFPGTASRRFAHSPGILKRTRELKADEKTVMDEGGEAGLLDGVAIPICGHNGELAGVGIASSTGGIWARCEIF